MKEALQGAESRDVRFLEAGIHDGAQYNGARKGETNNGNKFIEFSFVKEGKLLTATEYEPKKWPGDSDEKFRASCQDQALRILRILTPAYDEAVLSSFSGTSFDALCDWAVSLTNAISKDLKVRLKAVYDNKGYVTLPKYTYYTFIENMNIAKDKSMISELTRDKFTKPELGDKEEQVPTAAATVATNPF